MTRSEPPSTRAPSRPGPPDSEPPPASHTGGRLAGLLLVAITLAAFLGVAGNGFVNFDDPDYVTGNPQVRAGLTPQSFRWAWTTFHAANWHPLTWVSLQLDWQMYRGAAWGFHLTNLVLHLAATLVVFGLLRRLTGSVWRSFFVAALFAVHPLRVESVAWVAERKDVLSALFGLLALWSYARYAERPGPRRYLLVALLLALGLLSKPMLVTLPCVMLLLDYWPLRRWRPGRFAAAGPPAGQPVAPLPRLVAEKVPLLALALASSLVTVAAQHDALLGKEGSLTFRVENALVAYAKYLALTFWPSGLAPFYPLNPAGLTWGQAAGAGLLLAAVTALALTAAPRCPYLAVGWLWFVGMLVPVIGLVQVGSQALADRYTYLPHIGLFLLLVWGGHDLLARRGWERRLGPVLAGGVVAACVLVTNLQTSYWSDSVTLWKHAAEVTVPNYKTCLHLGDAYEGERRYDEATRWLAQAVARNPNDPVARNKLGEALLNLDRPEEATEELLVAARLAPDSPDVRLTLGLALALRGRAAEAAAEYREALRLRPGWGLAHLDLALALAAQGDADGALRQVDEAVRLDPDSAVAHHQRGVLLAEGGAWPEAAAALGRAARVDPGNVWYHCDLAQALTGAGETEAARAEYRKASDFDPDWPQEANEEAWALATSARTLPPESRLALRRARQACQATDERVPAFLDTLAAAHANLGQFDEASAAARQALAVASTAQQPALAVQIRQRLRLYEDHQPVRQAAGRPAP
jgi:tetratricopeptide (TPR) repeat protein